MSAIIVAGVFVYNRSNDKKTETSNRETDAQVSEESEDIKKEVNDQADEAEPAEEVEQPDSDVRTYSDQLGFSFEYPGGDKWTTERHDAIYDVEVLNGLHVKYGQEWDCCTVFSLRAEKRTLDAAITQIKNNFEANSEYEFSDEVDQARNGLSGKQITFAPRNLNDFSRHHIVYFVFERDGVTWEAKINPNGVGGKDIDMNSEGFHILETLKFN